MNKPPSVYNKPPPGVFPATTRVYVINKTAHELMTTVAAWLPFHLVHSSRRDVARVMPWSLAPRSSLVRKDSTCNYLVI